VDVADDDIEKLLAEINRATGRASGQPPVPIPAPQAPASRATATSRIGFAVVAAVGGAGLTWFIGLLMPFVSATSAGIGGAIAAGLTALVAGPPRWLGGR
jgi:hypothetical protein